ncbi:MAG: hypothetical protein HRT90_01280 [Candidatus Margulisbacteria bacterium]|nr:hypothetical protein [Candidatus Margulisiibacteriota bacterium]
MYSSIVVKQYDNQTLINFYSQITDIPNNEGISYTYRKANLKTGAINNQDGTGNLVTLFARFGILSPHTLGNSTLQLVNNQSPVIIVENKIIGEALVYPNPFKQREGGDIGYRLSNHMDIEIHIYNM